MQITTYKGIVRDSVECAAKTTNKQGIYEFTAATFVGLFPKSLLAQLRTHRTIGQFDIDTLVLHDFALSANSNRAIPLSIKIEELRKQHYFPTLSEKGKGMYGGNMYDYEKEEAITKHWLQHFENTIQFCTEMDRLGVHKQNVNRFLEPFDLCLCVLTSTYWNFFFELRCPHYQFDNKVFWSKYELEQYAEQSFTNKEAWNLNTNHAQQDIQYFAEMVRELYVTTPAKTNEVHAPFSNDLKENASHSARVSFAINKEEPKEKHEQRAKMLYEEKHLVPFEHRLTPMSIKEIKWNVRQTVISENKYWEIYNHRNLYPNIAVLQQDSKTFIKVEYGVADNFCGFFSDRFLLANGLTSMK